MYLAILKNQQGSLIQAIVAGGILIAGATVVITKNLNTKKLTNTIENKNQQTVFFKEISDTLASAEVCQATLSKLDPLTSQQIDITSIYSKNGQALFGVNSIIDGKKILSIKLTGYVPQLGFALTTTYIIFDTLDEDQLAEKQRKVFGDGKAHTQLKLLTLTEDNKVISCSSDQSGDVLAAFQAACQGLGGTYNPTTMRCQNLHGNSGMLITYIRQYLCHASGGGCTHPYAGKSCSSFPNSVLKGFKNNGALDCECLPVCPSPGDYCTGTSLGDDGCGAVCPLGSNDSLCSAILINNSGIFVS